MGRMTFEGELLVNYHAQPSINILRKFALPYIFKNSNDGFLVSNNDSKNIP